MELTIGFIGNPNCGKTTLFNDYTGANLKVANYPGVTVEKVEGSIIKEGTKIHLVDLPGAYSLTSYTLEERVTRSFILSDECDVVINVIDASTLERSLYLTLQLLELGKPVVVALNMMDIVKKRGMEIDLHRLPEMLGIPVIPVSARKREGLDILLHAAIHHKDQNQDRGSLDDRSYARNICLSPPLTSYEITDARSQQQCNQIAHEASLSPERFFLLFCPLLPPRSPNAARHSMKIIPFFRPLVQASCGSISPVRGCPCAAGQLIITARSLDLTGRRCPC